LEGTKNGKKSNKFSSLEPTMVLTAC
jgi:hypothetical protein